MFLKPDDEVLVVRDGQDLVDLMGRLTREDARAVGERALARVLAEHTYDRRAETVDGIIRRLAAAKRAEAAA